MKDVKNPGMGSFKVMGQLPDTPFVIIDPKDELRHTAVEQACRICGCTWNNACITDEGSCYWVESDLCSACARKIEMGSARQELRTRMLIGGKHIKETREEEK